MFMVQNKWVNESVRCIDLSGLSNPYYSNLEKWEGLMV